MYNTVSHGMNNGVVHVDTLDLHFILLMVKTLCCCRLHSPKWRSRKPWPLPKVKNASQFKNLEEDYAICAASSRIVAVGWIHCKRSGCNTWREKLEIENRRGRENGFRPGGCFLSGYSMEYSLINLKKKLSTMRELIFILKTNYSQI